MGQQGGYIWRMVETESRSNNLLVSRNIPQKLFCIQWTTDSKTSAVKYMRIDHRRGHVFMSEQLLNSPDVIAAFEQMSRKAMPQSMRSDVFVNVSIFRGSSDGILQTASMGMVTLRYSAAWIPGDVLGWEHILPFPLKLRTGVFNC